MIDLISPDFTNTPVSSRRPGFGYAVADNTAPPYVTIVTPFYNTGPVFNETARSVLQQSFQQWQWLIINDGSTEPASLVVLETYRHSDPRIRVIDHPANKGLSAARNTGFQAAQTEYIVQLDSDDLLEPTAIEKWLWFLESYPEYAFCKGYSVGFGAQEYLWAQGFHSGKAFLKENQVDVTSMVRKAVPQAIGGYDEGDQGGLMDWDFWLRCASSGYWGGTVPEYLDWYRRRPNHNDRWSDFDLGERQQAYHARLKEKYACLWQEGFPQIYPARFREDGAVPDVLPWENRLQKRENRLLMIVPWMSMGGADKFNLDLLEQLTRRGWEVTIAATLNGDHSWLPLFTRYTPDVFILHHFLRMIDYPRFLRYLIQSRQIDKVLIANSEFAYLLLPYLRAHFPEITIVDYCHMEEESRQKHRATLRTDDSQPANEEEGGNGGYPRLAVNYQEAIDLNIVSSEYLRDWMVRRGANPQKVEVCYTNVDPEAWQPDAGQQALVRRELNLPESVPLILYTARICRQKQPRVFAQTMLGLREQGISFAALAAGDGPDMEWLRSFVAEHELEDQVRLLGAVPNQRIRQLLPAADIFFLPSEWEGIALSLFEAMACGLPVVTADVGGQRELVTPECGVLIRPGDEKEEVELYVTILGELLNNSQLRHKMGQAGRMRVSSLFRLDQMGRRMINLLQQAGQYHTRSHFSVPLYLGRMCAAQTVEYAWLSQKTTAVFREQRDWIDELAKAKEWLEHQSAHWQQLAEKGEQAKTWLEEQRDRWQALAEQRELALQEQQAWIEEVEQAKAWLEEQRDRWQALAEQRELALQEQQAWIEGVEKKHHGNFRQLRAVRKWFDRSTT